MLEKESLSLLLFQDKLPRNLKRSMRNRMGLFCLILSNF